MYISLCCYLHFLHPICFLSQISKDISSGIKAPVSESAAVLCEYFGCFCSGSKLSWTHRMYRYDVDPRMVGGIVKPRFQMKREYIQLSNDHIVKTYFWQQKKLNFPLSGRNLIFLHFESVLSIENCGSVEFSTTFVRFFTIESLHNIQ